MDNLVLERGDQRQELWNGKFALPNASRLMRDIFHFSSETPFTLICFDVVSLRAVNDSYGRKVGGQLLSAIMRWITSLDFGQLYHLGGDAFCLLLTKGDLRTSQEKAKSIYNRFEEAWPIGRNGEVHNLFCAVSIGVISSTILHTPDDIFNAIERILKISFEQKSVAVYNDETNRLLKRRLAMEISLKECTKNNMQGFTVYYQPIVSAITGLWCSIEALCRWTSPLLGEIAPDEFIPIAEQQGIVGTIGEWVLETGVKQCKAWRLDTLEDFFLDVNLSPLQLLDENLDSRILDIINRHDYPRHKLSLEITESTQLNFNTHTLDAITRLTQQNILVALDDFGTGYSSFHTLAYLPVSVLKIEKSFLQNIENDEYLQRLLETMVNLAHASCMKIIVEGVENAAQMKMLMDNRVDFVQGFLFSKPLPPELFEKNLENFYQKKENSIAGEYSRIDSNSLFKSENAYSLPPSLYKALIQCMEILFDTPDINEGINTVLAVIGERLGVNRHVLFLKDRGSHTFTSTHEWCDEATSRHMARFKHIDININTPNFIPLFEKEGMIVSPDISILPKDIYQMFLDIGVKSNIAIPLWRGKELMGYVGLDVCDKRRNWLPEEVLLVHSVCGILANVLEKIYLQDEIGNREEGLSSVLNMMDISIYVSDLDTNEILFANDTLHKNMAATSPLAGKICWVTLYGGNTSRCSFCKLPQLLKNPDDPPVIWEHVNELTGRRYIASDCIIQWEDDKKAHLSYAIDITNFAHAIPKK